MLLFALLVCHHYIYHHHVLVDYIPHLLHLLLDLNLSWNLSSGSDYFDPDTLVDYSESYLDPRSFDFDP